MRGCFFFPTAMVNYVYIVVDGGGRGAALTSTNSAFCRDAAAAAVTASLTACAGAHTAFSCPLKRTSRRSLH